MVIGKAPSQRQLRVGELIRHALAECLARDEVNDPDLGGVPVTVSEVRMSPDLRNAMVFVMPLGGGEADKIVKALGRNAAYLRGQVNRRVQLKYSPQLRFSADSSYDYADQIDALLRRPKVAADLATDGGGTDGGED